MSLLIKFCQGSPCSMSTMASNSYARCVTNDCGRTGGRPGVLAEGGAPTSLEAVVMANQVARAVDSHRAPGDIAASVAAAPGTELLLCMLIIGSSHDTLHQQTTMCQSTSSAAPTTSLPRMPVQMEVLVSAASVQGLAQSHTAATNVSQKVYISGSLLHMGHASILTLLSVV